MNWGKGLTPASREAVATYLDQNALDITEIDLLGDNIYRNGKYFLRRLSEMTGAGVIEYARPDHINNDPRLVKLAADGDAWAKDELIRRMRERIALNVPEQAIAACAFRVKLKSVAHEFVGCKFVIEGKKKTIKKRDGSGSFTVDADPVGEQFPVETVETRALRRCLRLIASQIPALAIREEELRAQAVLLRDIVAKGRAEARMAEAPAHPAPVMQLPEGDPYGVNEVKTLSAGQEIAAEAAEPVDIAPEKAQTPAVTLPNWGPEHPLSCKPLREVDTRSLENLRATLFDRAQEKYVQLIEQIDLELDERRQAA